MRNNKKEMSKWQKEVFIIFNKKFPDQSTPETAQPSPSPSPSPEPVDPILPETQNLIIPKMNSNTFADEHGTWVASGSSKYSDVFSLFKNFVL